MRHLFFFLSAASILMMSCNTGSTHRFAYIPLEQYAYKKASIDSGTEIKLLAYSGGKEDDKENVYYYQFIGINSKTGDTVRILTPLISFASDTNPTQKIHSSPTMFNGSKRIIQATFNLPDSMTNFMLQTTMVAQDGKLNVGTDIGPLMHEMKLKQWVVVNKSLPIFENPSYKTAIGILHFSERPW